MKTKTRHNVDSLFVVLVFMLFTFSAVASLLLGINFYRKTVDHGNETSEKRTATAYLREIVRQHDADGRVQIGTFDGNTALIVPVSDDYVLNVYFYDNKLYELTTKKDSSLKAKDGQAIMELKSFNIEKKDDVLIVNTTDLYDVNETVVIGITSKEAN